MSSQVIGTSTSTKTKTVNGVKTTITTVTKKYADGRTETETTESSEGSQGCGGLGGMSSRMGNMKLDSGFDDFNKQFDAMKQRSRSPRQINNSGPQSTPSAPSAPSAASGPPPVDLKDFRSQALKAHNTRRDKHGVPKLKLSSDLNDYAQNWADTLIAKGQFQHSNCDLKGTRLGENIANKWSMPPKDYTGEEVTEQWYSEISKHNYSMDHQGGTGHFTQVVWKDTEELGIGKASDGKGKVIVVGSYRPAGNMIGTFKQNVFPPKK